MSASGGSANSDADPRHAWISRVLGVEIAPRAPRPTLAQAGAAWQSAREAADTQLAALRGLLLRTSDPDLHKIAEFGLGGITGKRRVTLETALRDLVSAKPEGRAAAAAKAAASAAEFRRFVETDKRIAACDACPSVSVRLRETLGGGLRALERALAPRLTGRPQLGGRRTA